LKKLVHAAVDHTTDLVEDAHDLVARKTIGYVELVPPLAGPARAVDRLRRLSSSVVFITIHGVNQMVDFLTDQGLDAVERASSRPAAERSEGEEAMTPMRSDAPGTAGWLADAALGVVNGVIGDYLREQGNSLDLGMSLRHDDRVLPLEREALARALLAATPRVAVFVHGLCCTEWAWCAKAEEHHGDPSVSFGTLLRRDLGFTPIYVRYNSGLHVSLNGRRLAELLEQLCDSYPVGIEELVLIGHSMGGLVAHSACHYASLERRRWLGSLAHVISLSAPLGGAPLEKMSNVATSVLRFFEVPGTRIPARILDARSDGIKDLRFGYLTDEEWSGYDPDAVLEDNRREVPLLDGVTYTFVSATITRSPDHPVGFLVGDLMVRAQSAAGPVTRSFAIETRHIGGLSHLDVQNHPDVYEQIRRVCASR
jgi:pimeloyl-ACP methyl ester carboxylesterase